jgi:hypothetical protein
MTEPQTPRNRYFQVALKNTANKMSPRTYRSATPSAGPPPPTGTLKVIAGPDPATCRVWFLPKASLARHSTYFAKLCANPFKHEVSLEDIDPRDFANFASYLHSSIYALNEQVPNFRAIHEATKAHLVGEKLGCRSYADAALRQLYMIFEPLARLRTSNACKSPLRASDIQFVCQHTTAPSTIPSAAVPEFSGWMRSAGNGPEKQEQAGVGLRYLFFDALASHWTQQEILNIGHSMDSPSDTARWTDVYNANTDFRITLASSLNVPDAWRLGLLKGAEEYLNPKTSVAGWIASSGNDGDAGDRRHSALGGDAGAGADDERERQILRPRSKIPSPKRRNSSDRRRSERAESGDGYGTGVRSWREGVVGSGGSGDVAITEEKDWMVVETSDPSVSER